MGRPGPHVMKRYPRIRPLPGLVLVTAGAVAGYLAYSAPERSYEPLTLDTPAPPPRVPIAVTQAPAEGEALRVLEVEGMCCGGCCAKLHEALTALPAVRAAAVDFERGVAEALVPADLPVAELAAALTFDKYSARPRP